MLERKKCQIVHATMLLQIIDEPRRPRNPSIRIRPDLNVFVYALKRWAAQLQRRIHTMNRRRPLQVQRGVILRQHVLPIGFLAHLNVGDRISALLQIRNLRRRVVGSVVQHRDRNHRRQAARYAAGEEQIESHLRLLGRSQIGWLMPRIDGRTIRRRLLLIRRVAQDVVKRAILRAGAKIKFANGIAHAVSRVCSQIGRAIRLAGV